MCPLEARDGAMILFGGKDELVEISAVFKEELHNSKLSLMQLLTSMKHPILAHPGKILRYSHRISKLHLALAAKQLTRQLRYGLAMRNMSKRPPNLGIWP